MKHTFSTNRKYNATLESIYFDLLHIHDTKAESLEEIRHYYNEFRTIGKDYNLAMYGNLLIYYYQVREMFLRCGYSAKHLARFSDSKVWEMYLYRVGEVVRYIMSESK